MRKTIQSLFCCIFLLYGCGGGGGFAIREKTIVNSIDIQKNYFGHYPNLLNKKYLLFSNGLDFSDLIRTKAIKVGENEYYNPISVKWLGNHYNIACLKSGSTFYGGIGIFSSNDDFILHLKTPRYTTGIVAIPIFNPYSNKSYLVICVKQQTTSKSSTIFILNESFEVVYEEYINDIDWVGKGEETSVFFIHLLNRNGVYRYIITE